MNSKGPFGLFMGMKIEDFTQSLEELAPFKFMLKNPPRPHPAFNNYLVQVTPKAGLSWIKAIGPGIKTNDYGFALADAFKEMEAKLTKTYSRCRQNDFLLPDSIWNEPKDWMTALEKKSAFWQVFGTARRSRCSQKPLNLSISWRMQKRRTRVI